MKKLVGVVFVSVTLVVMVLFSLAHDKEQRLVNDRYKAECVFFLFVGFPCLSVRPIFIQRNTEALFCPSI